MLNWKDYGQLLSKENFGFNCFAGRLYAHIYFDMKLYACGHCIGIIPGIPLNSMTFNNAFLKLKKIKNCNSCRVACDSENNLIYNLKPSVIINWLKKI